MQENVFLNIWLHRVRKSYIVITFICTCIEFVVLFIAFIVLFFSSYQELISVLYILYYFVQIPLVIFIGLRILFRLLNKEDTSESLHEKISTCLISITPSGLIFIFIPQLSSLIIVFSYVLLLYEDFKNYHPRTKPQISEVTHCEICDEPSLYPICNRCRGKYRNENTRIQTQLNRARQAGEPATLTLSEWVNICKLYHWQCYMKNCEKPLEALEHLIPIGQGDAFSGGTTKDNCRPICYSHNSKKSNRNPMDI